jgi:LppX/LprAFG-like lipoprotein
MIRRLPLILGLAVSLAVIACNSTPPGPALTDPTAIVTAALKATAAAKTVHVDLTVDGTASINLGLGGSAGTPIDVSGTTASADIDFARPAAKATFALKAGAQVSGELIAVDGTTYLKTSLTGPLYVASPAGAQPVDPTQINGVIDNVGDLLLKEGITLVKGDDVACGSKQCYTVSADLTAAQLGTTGLGSGAGLPVDLSGATLKLTVRVEKNLPYHLAGVTAVLSMSDGSKLTVDLTASKWDEPVTISAPPAGQVKQG